MERRGFDHYFQNFAPLNTYGAVFYYDGIRYNVYGADSPEMLKEILDDFQKNFIWKWYTKEEIKMERKFFLKTNRIGFSKWIQNDIDFAKLLWGNPEVTKYICSDGIFSLDDIVNRLNTEILNELEYQVQYWPIFELTTNDLIGCCGLKPHKANEYEIGFHLRPEFWGQGYAKEAANAVIEYAFTSLKAKRLFAGHNPKNDRSRKLLSKLGFIYIGDEFYEPTGLYHPSYELESRTGGMHAHENKSV